MRNVIAFSGLLLGSVLIYNCSGTKKSTASADFQTPEFNPNPTGKYLSPKESMATMHLPPGYRLQLVASEPMIKEPVAIAWDGNGRMYVAEMLTYMQDADAAGEQQKISRISLLEDTDNDGVMDKSTVFIDSLLLPRMMQPVGNELLVNETNTIDIYSYRDTNGDGKADLKKPVYQNDKYVVNDVNMEHQRSGLDWNLDNWMYLTYDAVRFRYTNGKMQVDTIVSGSSGQWGLTHDDYGRLFYSRAGGEIPALGFQINPKYGTLDFPDQYNAAFSEVWPIIATPDVQGGPPRLRPNETLNHFTAPTGQSIYRGEQYPVDFYGDYIVCEPVARAVRRAKVLHQNGKTTLQNVYQHKEFLSSSDMNFRPVNSATGPDGHLYIVDMHRGIIQQGNWTPPGSFLRQKIDSIGLAKNVGHGRIYRIVHESSKMAAKPHMLDQSPTELIAHLGHPNGWWRDNAQKELIARADKSIIPALKEIATGKRNIAQKEYQHLARIHALWTLEGMDAVDQELLTTAMNDPDPRVRKTAVWISEPYFKSGDEKMIALAGKRAQDVDDDVRVQVLLSLYNSKLDQAKAIVKEILDKGQNHEMLLATKTALDKNENVRTFGSRLGQMDEESRKLIIGGAAIFKSLCASCHGADAKGLAIGGAGMAAPPLAGSPRLEFIEKNNLVRIVLKGLTGPVDGKEYTSIMPAMEANSDEWVASVVSYIRHDFGGKPPRKKGEIPGMAPAAVNNESGFPVRKASSPVVTAEEVKKIRQETASRTTAWTIQELKPEIQE
ncbi:c-type cytochrome [Dyadobacter chenwenxiniae]|uniref:C-type cytochrome n=1 Tax=Dyadobacter chenwenxiniae TaxID=2906456 RepID=A0A9X1TG80_9BACT|nr:c-type cytochrome [Dyadobacter chenwenxiniae]MCF0063310.1 c-type cytochrome [Dyadobacter chenwenxiniae]UON85311.1 c-type cytochrome [Dyadobacter chenwenxiniae]